MSDWRELAEIASDEIGYECRHTGTPDDSVPGLCPECWELGGKIADAILAAGYRRIDHTEYALDHKSSDLQFTDDEGDLWTDEDYVKHYASDYGDTAPLVKRHVTDWEAAQP